MNHILGEAIMNIPAPSHQMLQNGMNLILLKNILKQRALKDHFKEENNKKQ